MIQWGGWTELIIPLNFIDVLFLLLHSHLFFLLSFLMNGWLILFEIRIMCKEEECNRFELLTEECLEIHKKIFHGDQQFKDGHKPIEHCCSKRNEWLKCNTLIETNIQGEPKYRDEKGKEYTDIESFWNRTTLHEIEKQGKSKEEERRYTVS